jgi:rhomboid protease GluP
VNDAFPELAGANGRPLAVVGLYATRSDAYERSLVIASMQLPHWIMRNGDQFALCVPPAHAEVVAAELAKFEAERADRPAATAINTNPVKHSTISLWLCGWIMGGFYAMQLVRPEWCEDRGTADSKLIMAGQWWRAFTALTLHADLSHIGGNLAIGILYAVFLLPMFGAGWTWLFIMLAGGLGNLINAWGYRDVTHLSIGASTAVFAALGILVGAQCATKVMALRAVRWREFLLPIGAGLGLLAYLGVGDPHEGIDYMAHFFGLIAGIPFGIGGIALHLGRRTPRPLQIILAWVAPAFLAVCWLLASQHK